MRSRSFASLLLVLGLTACKPAVEPQALPYSSSPTVDGTVYRIAPHPLYNPQTLHNVLQPMVTYLEQRIPNTRFELEASSDYQVFENKVRARSPHFIMPNPWQTLLGQKHGYSVLAMWGAAEDFHGLLVVRRDSPIREISDLKGKTISYPSPTAVAAAMLTQYWLKQQGLDIQHDVHNVYVGSQFSTLQHVLSGSSDVASTWPPPWRVFQTKFPQEAAGLRVLAQTPPLVNNSVMARDDVPAALAQQVQRVLLGMHEDPSGQRALTISETSRFFAANDASYAPVRDFIARFEREVRPVETKP